GQMRLFFNADGYFFSCERVSESSSATCIGSLNSGFDYYNAEKLVSVKLPHALPELRGNEKIQ
ncbi:MAG: hypothetical protein OSJ59_18425, partial [Lachnospiraceae bacterium]|nr:hypothetical protein [Lachnospiraceae bacterium]